MLGCGHRQVNVPTCHPLESMLQLHSETSIALIDTIWCIIVPMSKLRMNVYLNDKQKKALEKLSGKTGAPVAELIRRAIDQYLAMRKKELK